MTNFMGFEKEIIAHSDFCYNNYLPHLSIDSVVFGFDGSQLQVMLLKIRGKDQWILPGGYVGKEESTDEAAARILRRRSGVENIYLEQFGCFGDLNRTKDYFEKYPEDLWMKKRFITIWYYALVKKSDVSLKPDILSESCEWINIYELPKLELDHNLIVNRALLALRHQLSYKPIGINLLPEEFTMPELQNLHEAILGCKLNRGNFYRRMINEGLLDKTEKLRMSGGAHKAPIVYKFNKEKYTKKIQELDSLI